MAEDKKVETRAAEETEEMKDLNPMYAFVDGAKAVVRTGQEAFGKLTSQVQETADTIASKWYASYYAEMDPKDAGSSKFNEQVETSLRQLDASAAAADKGVDGVVIVGSREKMEQGMRDRVNEQTVHLMENTAD